MECFAAYHAVMQGNGCRMSYCLYRWYVAFKDIFSGKTVYFLDGNIHYF
jgi:hypothetical protein